MRTTVQDSLSPLSVNEVVPTADISTRTSHLTDDVLASALPGSAGARQGWRAFAQNAARKIGLGTAFALTGFGGFNEKSADAGIVITGGDDAQYRANGAAMSVEGGGNVASFKLQSELGITGSSLTFINPYTAITGAHQYDVGFGVNQSYNVGTAANSNVGPFYNPANIYIHPEYGGAAGRGVDLAVVTFSFAVPGVSNVEFAAGRAAVNEVIWLAGYGETGSPDRGYVGRDGFIRAGTSTVRGTPPILGGDPALYQNTLFSNFPDNPTGLRGAQGDSGGGVFTTDGKLTGIIIGGSFDISGRSTMFLSISAPVVRDFIELHSINSVPEPSSLLLLGSLAAAGAGHTLLRRQPRK